MGTRQSTRGRRRDTPLQNVTGGHPPRGRPVPGHRCRPPRLSSPPVPGPAATAAALLFLPPVLSLIHPALYLPASILVLLTPARNSASLPAPPPRLPPTATTTLTTSAASTPRWTRCLRTTGRGPPSPRRCRPYRPQWGGGVQNTAPCRSQNHAATLAGTSARSSLVVVIVGGGLAGRKRRWWRLPGAEAAAEEAAAAVIIW
jgi:hypothetical protein